MRKTGTVRSRAGAEGAAGRDPRRTSGGPAGTRLGLRGLQSGARRRAASRRGSAGPGRRLRGRRTGTRRADGTGPTGPGTPLVWAADRRPPSGWDGLGTAGGMRRRRAAKATRTARHAGCPDCPDRAGQLFRPAPYRGGAGPAVSNRRGPNRQEPNRQEPGRAGGPISGGARGGGTIGGRDEARGAFIPASSVSAAGMTLPSLPCHAYLKQAYRQCGH